MESHVHADPTSTFGSDPFAPLPSFPVPDQPPQMRSIEDILKTLSGYRTKGQTQSVYQSVQFDSQPQYPFERLRDCQNSKEICGLNEVEIVSQMSTLIALDSVEERGSNNLQLPVPTPIRGAFNCDPDLYDQCSLEERCQTNLQTIEELTASQGSTSASEESDRWSKNIGSKVFWAAPNQVIQIDAQDGYEFIDLSCFQLSQASFQGNRIVVQVDSNHQFEIEYINVSYAVFANGEKIQLNDTGLTNS